MPKVKTPVKNKKKKAKGPGGRPSPYREEYNHIAREHCKKGATDLELAEMFQISIRTLYQWKTDHPEFSHAIDEGKGHIDDQVEKSMLQRALGYDYEEEKAFCAYGQIVTAKIKTHIPPNVDIGKWWLKNRRPDKWKDKQELEVAEIQPPNIQVIEAHPIRALPAMDADEVEGHLE